MHAYSYYLSWKADDEVPYCPGLSVQLTEPATVINVSIKNSIFYSNRGKGTSLYINGKGRNPNIALTGLQFWNNSAIKFDGRVSTLRVVHKNSNINNHYQQSLLNMSSCNFYDNHGGQNMLSYAVEGGPSKVIIDHRTFLSNNFSNALIKLKVQTKILLISNTNFVANTHKGGVIHLLVYSTDFTLVSIKFEKNFDSIVGGVVVSLNSNENIKSI